MAWAGPMRNLVRTPAGEAEWETRFNPEWAASVGSWPEATRESIEAEAQGIEGVPVILDHRARRRVGTIFIDGVDGQFEVTHRPDE